MLIHASQYTCVDVALAPNSNTLSEQTLQTFAAYFLHDLFHLALLFLMVGAGRQTGPRVSESAGKSS
jgi:hypothetical protein